MYLSSRVLPSITSCAGMVAAILACATPAQAADEGSPGLDAIESFRQPKKLPKAVENRFFLKENRFEISPLFGYVPNNPFAVRYSGGAILGFHFNETLSLQSQITYSPDGGEKDLKGLVGVLLDRAANASGEGDCGDPTDPDSPPCFQQPLDKVGLSASFGVAWAPLYGKINLVGETVLNFDFYGFAGLGMVSKHNYIATYDANAVRDADASGSPRTTEVITNLGDGAIANEVKVAPVLGIGQNFFLNQMMSLKIDARSSLYVDNKPQYDPSIPVDQQRVYNNFMVSAGLGFFFPKMKPRLYNF